MAKITNGHTFGVNAKQAQAARMLADGISYQDIASVLFDCRTEDGQSYDRGKLTKAANKVRAWTKNASFQECYRAIIAETAMPAYGKALSTITKQMDNENAWLANKAANDVLTRFGDAVMGTNDHEIVVRVEGAPEIGAPEVEE